MLSDMDADLASLAKPRFPTAGESPGDETMAWVRTCTAIMQRHPGLTVVADAFHRMIDSTKVAMMNLIGLPASSPLRVLLIAHADSLRGEDGAIDSAVGMVVAMHLAHSIGHSVGVALVDGEEAYDNRPWSPSTAMSGSQRLVKWLAARHLRPERVIVLDLWGGPPTSVFTVHRGASAASREDYVALVEIERLLRPSGPWLFSTDTRSFETQDDSWPFLRHPTLYPRVIDLLATPFPPQWHKPGKDVALNVNWDTACHAMRVLVMYLENTLGRS
jgi:hypothetical protein